MWEQIHSNRRKSAVLVVVMAALLMGLGYAIAEAYAPGGGVAGIFVAFLIWLGMSLVAYFQGDSILLAVSGAKRIEKEDHPQLFNVVEEMAIASGQQMPAVYIMDDMAMNAFAAGRKPENASVAVTAGLLGAMNRDELQGVVAHEMAHVKNRDVLLMTMAGVMLGAIVMISEVFLRSLWRTGVRGGGRRYSGSRSKSGSGKGAAVVAVLAIVLAILAPILARLIYFAISRRREYLADASAAQFTRYPDGLASALEKIGTSLIPFSKANKATAPMFIANPFKKRNLNAWTSTHPPLAERVKILRSIGGSVSYQAYQRAWGTVGGRRAGHLPKSALEAGQTEPVRAANPETTTPKDQRRQAGDALRKLNHFIFLPCVCGLRVKLPPDFKRDSINCPRCQRVLTVPVAAVAAATGVGQILAGAKPGEELTGDRTVLAAAPLTIKRKPGEWMSFKCSCGAAKTLSPSFTGNRTRCDACGRHIEVT